MDIHGGNSEVLGGRQSEGQPARETALVCSLPSTRSVDFVRTSISLKLKPASSAGLGSTSSKWGQYGVWYGHYGTQYGHYGTPAVTGPSTIEPIVPTVAQLGAQDTSSVIQRAQDTPSVKELGRPLVQSRQCSLLRGTAPCCTFLACRIRHPCRTLPCLLC